LRPRRRPLVDREVATATRRGDRALDAHGRAVARVDGEVPGVAASHHDVSCHVPYLALAPTRRRHPIGRQLSVAKDRARPRRRRFWHRSRSDLHDWHPCRSGLDRIDPWRSDSGRQLNGLGSPWEQKSLSHELTGRCAHGALTFESTPKAHRQQRRRITMNRRACADPAVGCSRRNSVSLMATNFKTALPVVSRGEPDVSAHFEKRPALCRDEDLGAAQPPGQPDAFCDWYHRRDIDPVDPWTSRADGPCAPAGPGPPECPAAFGPELPVPPSALRTQPPIVAPETFPR